jgi:regulator of protease activity HflC (stomatin/prohibitin superfamily)
MAPRNSSEQEEIQQPLPPSPFVVTLAVIAALAVLIVFLGSWFTVGAGEVGVVFNKLSGVTSSATQGFHGKLPLVQSVTTFSVKTQKMEIAADSASKDLQKVSVHVVLDRKSVV